MTLPIIPAFTTLTVQLPSGSLTAFVITEECDIEISESDKVQQRSIVQELIEFDDINGNSKYLPIGTILLHSYHIDDCKEAD